MKLYQMEKIVALLFTLLTFSSVAQSSFGGYSSKVKWKQINTEKVRVIFPDSLEDKAQRVVNIIHYMNNKDVGLLGKKRKKVDIILRNNDAISNGYAQIAPYKSEFFMQAPQDTWEESSVDWVDQLAIHEYRHTNQFVNAKRGIGHLIYWLFGDYGWGGIIGVTAPAWFVEGDATITETALSSGGRGRVPSFTAFQRAQQLEGVEYSYMKAMNGSFKDFVPNHYNTGYLILSEIRREHDNVHFDTITSQAARFKGIIYPFRKAVKRVTGTKIKDHYFNASSKLKASIPSEPGNSIVITSDKKGDVVTYDNPIIDKNGELYFIYGDRQDINGIYKYDKDGNHKRITYQGLILDRYFNKHKNLYVWSELQRDIRAGNQNYSNIILYDEAKDEKRIIGRGKAYFSPSFSNDGKNLIFVNAYSGIESGISMMNMENNAMLSIVKSKTKQFLYPIQSENGKSIYAIIKENQNYALGEIGMDGSITMLTPWDKVVFGRLKVSDGHLIYQANYGSTDQVYAMDLKTKSIKKISNDPIGMYNPSNIHDGKLVATRPHSRGWLLHEIAVDMTNLQTIKTDRKIDLPYYLKTDHLEPNDILDDVPNEQFVVSKYPRTAKLFNPHSWLLYDGGPEFSTTLFSDNIINNVSIQPSYRYNFNTESSFVDLSVNYGRWFPIYQLAYSGALPRRVVSQDGDRTFIVSQHTIRPGFIIPLNLTKGTYITSLRFSNSLSQTFTHLEVDGTDEEFNQQETTLNNSVSFTHRRLLSTQNYYPRWGYSGTILNRQRFNDSHNAFNMVNDFYVPGFHRNHGFKFEIDYALKNDFAEDRTDLIDQFKYAPGFESIKYDNIWSANTYYGMPIAYPDWGFADFMYFKRVNSVLFHNYNKATLENETTEFQSMGVDLLFDVVFNNTVFSEITVGFRNAYMIGPLPEGKSRPYHFEFLIDIPAF
ncbi:TolB-like translocation protein [Portibacter lacus]|uniref:Uncharacterized protein n=1 Tax=Portibacter lacus TaxID=1099794 RepID=A0AA37SSN9_9BACT|nr:hypothetical protein [Portibacter lacus]GLR17285.1 hypothetical protein GCM10007940_19000 [Portibacter lacus]